MPENLHPKRMSGALLSGVFYLDEQGTVKEIHWCVTPDGDNAPVDVQPVIRVSRLDEANDLIPAMLSELTERFARAAAAEAAKAIKNTKKQASANKQAIPPTAKAVPDPPNEKDDDIDQDSDEIDEVEETMDNPEPEDAGPEDFEASSPESEPEQPESPVPVLDSKPDRKISGKPKEAPAMPSLFDGLDLS